ncbi:MAG: hypothetical protein FWD87_08155 [Spirochaetaceae bacterium]|nr:hypothetical protein [Spirochaetaceae bacterium]
MNTNLLNILKRIVSEKGENILADPQKLKPLFSDYAKDEPKEERVAFGRCIEIGAYHELKNTCTVGERHRKKTALTNQLHANTGIEKTQCTTALDLLEAVIFTSAQSVLPSSQRRISMRAIIFGIVGALGGWIGSIIGEYIVKEISGTFLRDIMHWAIWIVMVAIGVSIGLLIAQSLYLKKKPISKSLLKTMFFGILISGVAGIIAGIIVNIGGGNNISRTIAWGITGLGIGLAATIFIPNFPKKRAMIAGLSGGVIGFIISIPFSVQIGDMILGLFVGLSVSVLEEALRKAWLTIIWGPKETRTIALGQKPIIFGSSSEADVYLSKDKEPSVRATVHIENSKVVMYDKKNKQQQVLQDGQQIDFEKVSFVVSIKNP